MLNLTDDASKIHPMFSETQFPHRHALAPAPGARRCARRRRRRGVRALRLRRRRRRRILDLGATVKRRKGSQLQLWDLPAGVLCDIISRQPIRDAIRTSILSSQCRYLWCDHSNLTFDCYTLRSGHGGRPINVPDFIAKVDAILEQHSGVGVKAMVVSFAFLRNKHASHIDRWVEFAVGSRTKELSLNLSCVNVPINREQAYNFPCHLLDGSYVRSLQLTSVYLNLHPGISGLLNLRKLCLAGVGISEEHVEYLLSKCTLLEFLKVAYCRTLTSIRALHPMNRLKHLVVNNCILLQRIEMNCGLTTLVYTGPVVPLQFATVSRLSNVRINLLSPSYDTVLDYITTGFPSTLPHLETFSVRCKEEDEGVIFLVTPNQFMYLRHLRLEVAIFDKNQRKTDVLNYAYLLDAVPSLEKLELHMWLRSYHQLYGAEHGELRSLTSHSQRHTHLILVYFTGFFGSKDQVELALHILHNCVVLESMKIDPAVKIIPGGPGAVPAIYERHHYIDGHMVATEFVSKADHNNVVEVAVIRMAPEATQTAT